MIPRVTRAEAAKKIAETDAQAATVADAQAATVRTDEALNTQQQDERSIVCKDINQTN